MSFIQSTSGCSFLRSSSSSCARECSARLLPVWREESPPLLSLLDMVGNKGCKVRGKSRTWGTAILRERRRRRCCSRFPERPFIFLSALPQLYYTSLLGPSYCNGYNILQRANLGTNETSAVFRGYEHFAHGSLQRQMPGALYVRDGSDVSLQA